MQQVNSLFISDVHLGSKDCQAEFLLHLLENTDCKQLFLIGDIVDLWALQQQLFWPASHHHVLNCILRKAQHGCQVFYLPGNHDAHFHQYHTQPLHNIHIVSQYHYTGLNGQKWLLLHGDVFDAHIQHGKLAQWLGEPLYDVLLWCNRFYNSTRAWLGYEYFSFASYIKNKVPKAQAAIAKFKHVALNHAYKSRVDGIMCGHIHQPELTLNHHHQAQLWYANTGDWVEHCTALVEHLNGVMELWHCANLQREATQPITSLQAMPVKTDSNQAA